MGMDALASELYYIAVEAGRAGHAAVVGDRCVAILSSTQTHRCVDEPAYVSYRVDRVRSLTEARALLRPAA